MGYACLVDSKSNSERVQLQLTPEVLVLLREEYVPVQPEEEDSEKKELLDKVLYCSIKTHFVVPHS